MGLMDTVRKVARKGFEITDPDTAAVLQELSSDGSAYDDDALAIVPVLTGTTIAGKAHFLGPGKSGASGQARPATEARVAFIPTSETALVDETKSYQLSIRNQTWEVVSQIESSAGSVRGIVYRFNVRLIAS